MYVMKVDMFGWFLIILIQNISSQPTLPDFWQSVLHMEFYLHVLNSKNVLMALASPFQGR